MRMGWKSVDKVQPGGSSSLDLFARSRRFRLTVTLLNNMLWVALACVCVFHICSCVCKSFRIMIFFTVTAFLGRRDQRSDGRKQSCGSFQMSRHVAVALGPGNTWGNGTLRGGGHRGHEGHLRTQKSRFLHKLLFVCSWQAADCGFHASINN